MELSKHYQYLSLTYNFDSNHHIVRIHPTLTDSLLHWDRCTRISPIFGIRKFRTSDPATTLFSGNHYLIFIGPVMPAVISDDFDPSFKMWITLGLFNVIMDVNSKETKDKLLEWAITKGYRYEIWELNNEIITNFQFSPFRGFDPNLTLDILEIAQMRPSPELLELISEYCSLMASTKARANQAVPKLLSDLSLSNCLVKEILNGVAGKDLSSSYLAQSLITKINSGLSRLSSQTFSGFSPIIKTECHYWTHSLLGTGVANLALYEIFNFIRITLGNFRIPQRLSNIEPKERLFDLTDINYANEFWYEDHLGKVILTEEDLGRPLFPLFTYYSGRDGFKSTLTTLSAPLVAVSSCNSKRWTLMTLTHEISHIFVNGCLAIIYPDINLEADIQRVMEIIVNGPHNWIEEITRYLIFSIIAMENNYSGRHREEFGADDLRVMLDNWHHHVEELMAHIFDFLYFYRGNYENYIKSIWLSWSVIPNIGNRIPEYVERSLCAILALHLRRGYLAENTALDQLRNTFIKLKEEEPNLPYLQVALDYLDTHQEIIIGRAVSRKGIIAIVRTFLFSETARAKLFEEHKIRGDRSHTEGYDKVMGRLDSELLDNPLLFLDIFTREQAASPAKSLWLLSTITFNAGRN